jgi:hypothetical protein
MTLRSLTVPTSLSWYNADETVLQVIFEGSWTIEEFVGVVGKVHESIELKMPTPVSIILNMEKSGGIPRAATVLPHFKNAVTKLQYQYMIIAGGTSFGLALTRIVMQVLPHKNRSIFFEENVAAAEKRIGLLRASTQ